MDQMFLHIFQATDQYFNEITRKNRVLPDQGKHFTFGQFYQFCLLNCQCVFIVGFVFLERSKAKIISFFIKTCDELFPLIIVLECFYLSADDIEQVLTQVILQVNGASLGVKKTGLTPEVFFKIII